MIKSRKYLRGQVVKIGRWEHGGFGADVRFHYFQQEVFSETVGVMVKV